MIGNDNYGNFFEDTCTKKGIGTTLIRRHDMQTGVATTFISPDGERTFATYLGAASAMQDNDLDIGMMFGSRYILIEGFLVQDKKLMSKAAEIAERDGLRISLDMASYNIVENERDFFREFIRDHVDIVFANESEAKAFTRMEPREALDELARHCSIAVVKIGKDGSMLKSGDEYHFIEAWPADTIDATGAGDTYAAGFLYAHSLGMPLKVCGEVGSIIAAKVVEVIGTKIDIPRWKAAKQEIRELLAKNS